MPCKDLTVQTPFLYVPLYVPVCSWIFLYVPLYVPVCSWIFLYVPVCSCMSLYVPVCPFVQTPAPYVCHQNFVQRNFEAVYSRGWQSFGLVGWWLKFISCENALVFCFGIKGQEIWDLKKWLDALRGSSPAYELWLQPKVAKADRAGPQIYVLAIFFSWVVPNGLK